MYDVKICCGQWCSQGWQRPTPIKINDLVLVHSGNSKAFLNVKASKLKFVNNDKAKVKLNVTTHLATFELNGDSKTEALIKTDSIQFDLYQRADAKIEGDAEYVNIRADNSSNFVGKNLTANSCDLICDLNSDVYVNAVESLSIEASGNSEVYIYNTPKIILNKFIETSKLHKKEMN